MAGDALSDARTGKNGRHALVGMLWQSIFGRLAGYEDVNDAQRLRHDPDARATRRRGAAVWARLFAARHAGFLTELDIYTKAEWDLEPISEINWMPPITESLGERRA